MRSNRLRGALALLMATCACFNGAARAQKSGSLADAPASVGRWTARFLNGGIYLDYDGVPLLRGGLLQLFSSDGSHGYYGSGSNPPAATVEPLPDGGRRYTAQFHYADSGRAFDATQQIDVHPQDRVTFMLRARWHASDPAQIEWNPIRLWAYPLIGADYTSRPAQGDPRAGRVGYSPLPGVYPATSLSAPWTGIVLAHTAVGEIRLDAQGEPAVLYDGREDPYLQEDRLFWGGCPALKIAPDREVAETITLVLAPKMPAAPAAPLALARLIASRTALTAAQTGLPPLVDAAGHPVLVPLPKSVRFASSRFPLPAVLPVTILAPHDADGRRVRDELARLTDELRRDAGVARADLSARAAARGLVVAVAVPAGRGLPQAPERAEGYLLRVSPSGVLVVGHDAAGAFYGLQTLRQLLRTEPNGRASIVGVEIRDWPSLPFRGAHIFVGHDALPFHTRLIGRIFSRYKLNKMVIECEYTAWRSHPEIHVPNSMPPDDLRAEVAIARDHFIEPIPLVNSLGHSEWIFKNGQHRDLAEDVRSPHAYNASDPAAYRFLFDIYGETLDIFHPRLFHIGHDEVKIPDFDQFGRYPARPENVRKGVTALFVEDTGRLASWLRARGVRTMMWADMLLNEQEGAPRPGLATMSAANAPSIAEARRRRTLIPKDAILCDWRYAGGSEQRNGLTLLKRAGFDTIGCGWYDPENICGWAQQAIASDALGTLQTTWAGYDSNERLLDTDYRQFTAYLLAAEYAWSGTRRRPPAKTPDRSGRKSQDDAGTLPYSAADLFARSYQDALPYGRARSGWALDLRQAANVGLDAHEDDRMPWTVVTREVAAAGKLTLRRDLQTGLMIAAPDLGVMLHSVLDPPAATADAIRDRPASAIVLPVGARASMLAFLHAVGYGVARETGVGSYTVVYSDGKRVEIPLRCGYEIGALDDDTPSDSISTTLVPWQEGGTRLTLRLFRWTNPRPDAMIASLEFRAADPQAAPVLFGVTGAQSR